VSNVCYIFPLFLVSVPNSCLIPSVRASINVVSITAAAAVSLIFLLLPELKGGRVGGGKEVGERLAEDEEWVGG
jgi:hypothetical protein